LRLLVTGAAGFIGSNFVRRIADGTIGNMEQITVLDKLTYAGVLKNLDSANSMPGLKIIKGDICDSVLVSQLLESVDCVVNFAAESHVDRSISNSVDFVNTNVMGVQVLLAAIKASSRGIRFIQVSSDEVYGSIRSGSWSEDSPLRPNSPYSATKAAGDMLTLAFFRTFGLDVVVTRCTNNYGQNHFPEKLIPLFITNLIEGKKVTIYGNGENVRDWLHVDDHCRAIYSVLMNGRSGEVYNIGGGRELTNNKITSLIFEAMGTEQSSIDYIEDRKGHDFRYSVDWTKINRELGYEPQVLFEDGLRDTIQWYRDNEAWWKPLKNC